MYCRFQGKKNKIYIYNMLVTIEKKKIGKIRIHLI